MNIVNRSVLIQLTKFLGRQAAIKNSNKVLIQTRANMIKFEWALRTSQTKFYFASLKSLEPEQQQFQQQNQNQASNLPQYIKNQKTISILEKKGIKSLFPIQIQTFEAVYEGRDILASDRTGSGKTIAYSLPIIEKLRDQGIFKSGRKQVKFLVMCPTRELCLQVFKEISSLKHNSSDFNVVAVYGGAPTEDQVRELRNGVDIIVATPGRLMDLLDRRCINFTELEATCIDEADQMLEKGFKLDVQNIFNIIETQRKQKTQNLMFSATIPPWVDKISHDFMDQSKKKINLISKGQNQTSRTVQHMAVECPRSDRINCIKSLIRMYNKEQQSTIIFAETKIQVTDLAMQFGKDASFLQGDMSQKQRQFNLNAFRNGKRKILIATDVASRGLDIDNVGLVIQLEPPRNTQPFIHRAGRTGRAGKKGICITLFERKKNLQSMLRIEEQAKMTFNHVPKPHFEQSNEIWSKRLNKIPHDLKQVDAENLKNQQIELMADVLLSSHSDVRELVKRQLVALVGQPPMDHSLSTDQPGFKTFTIAMKEKEAKINTLNILNFLKTNFESVRITNVHVQSSNIIFDIPTNNLQAGYKLLQNQQIKESAFQIREAIFKDREMMPLKDLVKNRRRQGSIFENRNRQRGDMRTSSFRDRDNRRDDRRESRNSLNFGNGQQNIDLFVPGLPQETQLADLEEELRDLNIVYDTVRLKKKSDDNIFAFVSLKDPSSIKQLVKSGLVIQGKKVRVLGPQKKSDFRY